MKKKLPAVLMIVASLLSAMGELRGWLLPTLSWPFTVSRELSFLSVPAEVCPTLAADGQVHWFGWAIVGLLFIAGVTVLLRRQPSFRLSPQAQRAWHRFRSHRRAYYSLLILGGIILLAAADQIVVGKRALAVQTEQGEWYFPAFRRSIIPGAVFGLSGNAAHAEADYRALHAALGSPGGPQFVLMPPIPWAPTNDPAPYPMERLVVKDGLLCTPDGKTLFDGQACRLYANGDIHLRIRYRRGKPDGHVQGWSRERHEVYAAVWSAGHLITETYDGAGSIPDFLKGSNTDHYLIHYHPAPPLTGDHLLGTDSQGSDIAAYLFGGLQVNIQAALFYLPAVYAIGIMVGMLMGYLGGAFDIVTQRLIEILSQLPFLFLVMILTDFVPAGLRGMFVTLTLMVLLGWMPMTYLIRTATMREKARDYVSAARAMGAGPLHILARHVLPNLSPIVITLIPFSVATVVLSLTSLDYLGFGLPDSYAAWGRLLNDGLSKLSSPWVASSAVAALVLLLLLITFIGEGVREAIDPHRHDHYA